MKYIFYPLLIMSLITLAVSPKRFGNTPQGARKERVHQSPNYRDGKFQNLSPTPHLTSEKSKAAMMLGFLFRGERDKDLRPDSALPAVKTNLRNLNPREDWLVWFGHSSVLLQVGGKRILVDPVFSKAASPVAFFNKAFKGTTIYAASDIPDIDYLIISHDHWDHLDYPTVAALKSKVAKIFCPLGVGEHFERWKFDMARVVEMDWNDAAQPDSGVNITCLPSRHFSGRGFSPNQSLWASFLVATPAAKIYISGDGGYDTHFADIGKRFGPIDLAVIENGQYGEGWRYIHMTPEEAAQAGKDLRARVALPVHSSKFALGRHSWREPLDRFTAAHDGSYRLITPMIGEPVFWQDSSATFTHWWKK